MYALNFEEAITVPVKYRRSLKLKNMAWLFGYRSNSESFVEAKQRAELGADMLIELAHDNKDVLLVGHGIMNRLITKALVKRGAVIKEQTGDSNLAYRVLEMNL